MNIDSSTKNQEWYLVTLRVQGQKGSTNNIEKDEPVNLREQTTQKGGCQRS